VMDAAGHAHGGFNKGSFHGPACPPAARRLAGWLPGSDPNPTGSGRAVATPLLCSGPCGSAPGWLPGRKDVEDLRSRPREAALIYGRDGGWVWAIRAAASRDGAPLGGDQGTGSAQTAGAGALTDTGGQRASASDPDRGHQTPN
jgi:hypothetical protein